MKLLPESTVNSTIHHGEKEETEKGPELKVNKESFPVGENCEEIIENDPEILAFIPEVHGPGPGPSKMERKETGKRREQGKRITKTVIEKSCLNCNKSFTATNPKQRYCSGACKTAYPQRVKNKWKENYFPR